MSDKAAFLLPILLITVGTGWLLTTMGVLPGIDWIWTLGLAAIGLVMFLLGGFDKITFVVGTFFILASVLSILRQTGRLHFDLEVPILVILAGLLLLFARLPIIPDPKWLVKS